MISRKLSSAASAASIVPDLIVPEEKVSRPSSTPRDASSMVLIGRPGAISLTTSRMALAPMSSTATSSGAAAFPGSSLTPGVLLSEVSPALESITVFLEPAVADILTIVHVGNHHVPHAVVGLPLRLLHRRSGAADDQHDA